MQKEIKNSEQKEENLVKKTCRELGITQKELAERIGLSANSIKRIATSETITNQVKKAIELLLLTEHQKKELERFYLIKSNLKQLLI
jgi:predicted transcriptional regulator